MSQLPPSNNGQKLCEEICPRLPHSEGDSAPLVVSFPQRGIQLSPVVVPELVSAARMRRAACHNGFYPGHPPISPWDQAPSSPSQTFRLPFPCFLLCCSSRVRGPSCTHSESHVIILLCAPPYNARLSPARWCNADTFTHLADKCFIPPPYVIVQLLFFIFRLEAFWGME